MLEPFNPQMGKKTRVTSLTDIFELEFDGYVFVGVAMLAGDLNGISKSPCHKKVRVMQCTDKSKLD